MTSNLLLQISKDLHLHNALLNKTEKGLNAPFFMLSLHKKIVNLHFFLI
jgi:hypothetical protein